MAEQHEIKKNAIESIYLKPSHRRCSVSEYRCFDIYDQDMNKINIPDCDVIDICIENIKLAFVSLEIGIENGMIHIWSNSNLDFEPLINTFIIHLKGDQR